MFKTIGLCILIFFAPTSQAFAIDYFVGANSGQCAAYIAKLETMMGHPNPATKTVKYAEMDMHQGPGNSGKCIVILESVWLPSIGRGALMSDIDSVSTAPEMAKRKTREQLEGEEAF